VARTGIQKATGTGFRNWSTHHSGEEKRDTTMQQLEWARSVGDHQATVTNKAGAAVTAGITLPAGHSIDHLRTKLDEWSRRGSSPAAQLLPAESWDQTRQPQLHQQQLVMTESGSWAIFPHATPTAETHETYSIVAWSRRIETEHRPVAITWTCIRDDSQDLVLVCKIYTGAVIAF
jgi:Txe/YoeB family toxin of Txe-Axe toxin-antitoxin module